MKNVKMKLLAWVVTLSLIGLIFTYSFEFQRFENTVDVNDLLLKSLAGGLAAGIFAGWRLARHHGREQVERMQIWAACLLGCLFFSPLVGSLSNRLFSPREPARKQVEFFEEKPFYASRFGIPKGEKIAPTGYYTFFIYDGNMERIKSESQHFQGVQRGDTVEIRVKKGLFGYDVILLK